MNHREIFTMALGVFDLATKSVAILLTAWLLVFALRRASATSRHLVWITAFSMLLILPILTLVVPARSIGLFHEPVKAVDLSDAPFQTVTNPRISLPISSQSKEHIGLSQAGQPIDLPTDESPKSKNILSTLDWTIGSGVLIGLWIAGVIYVAAQGLWGICAVGSLRSNARRENPAERLPIDHELLSQRVGLCRVWELRVSNSAVPPAAMTWGLIRPVVLLPKDSASWSQERLEAVLLHELAHVRRLDSLSQLISIIVCALYWFNPAVWLCARAMRAEAESAADDIVIGSGVKPSDYAEELLRIAAELGQRRQPFTQIGVPVMKQSKIEYRVRGILNTSARRRRGITVVEALITVFVAAAILIPMSSVRAAFVPNMPEAMTTAVEPSLVLPQSNKAEDEQKALDARIKKLQAEKKAKIDPSANIENKKLAEALKSLMAQAKVMRDQLAKTKAELTEAKRKLEVERTAKLKSLSERDSNRVSKQMADWLRADEEKVRHENQIAKGDQLKAGAEQLRSQKEQILQKLMQSDAKKQMEAAERLMQMAQKEYVRSNKNLTKDQESANRDQIRALVEKQYAQSQQKLIIQNQAAANEQALDAMNRLLNAKEQSLKSRMDGARSKTDSKLADIEAIKQLEIAKIKLAEAKKKAARMRSLYEQGYIHADDRDSADADVRIAEAELNAAKARVDAGKGK